MTQENKPYVEGEKFTRAWINLDKLPGGMMHSSQVGLFGPVPASSSCWITTSEQEVGRMRLQGPVLEIFTQRPPEKTVLDVSDLYGNRDAVERVHHFYTRHAIGGLAAPDCLACGRSTQIVDVAIKHKELPDVVICTDCADRIDKASSDEIVGDFQPLTPERDKAIAASIEQRYGETIRAAVQLAFEKEDSKERARFEKYYADIACNEDALERPTGTIYKWVATEAAWELWQAAVTKQVDARETFLDYWCADIPDYLRDKWCENVRELLDTPNANEKMQAAWDAWKAATGAPQ